MHTNHLKSSSYEMYHLLYNTKTVHSVHGVNSFYCSRVNSINWLIYAAKARYVNCEVRTEFVFIMLKKVIR
jgi:hypothetical protein